MHVVCNDFGDAVEDALEVVSFASELHFDDDVLAFAVASHHVHAVVLVGRGLLVAFAFKYFFDGHFFAYEHGHQPFEDVEVGLVAKHALGSPVESYILFVNHIDVTWFLVIYCVKKDSFLFMAILGIRILVLASQVVICFF